MDISVLNSTFRRERLIENWSSLVWTERHSKNGDFQLVSTNIGQVLDLLPLGDEDDPPTLVCINDSDTPMVVETHKIDKQKNGVPQITTTGRSFETVLDRRVPLRVLEAGTAPVRRTKGDWFIDADTVAIAVYELLEAVIVNGEVSLDDSTPSTHDIIPEIALFNSVTDTGTSQRFTVEPKELYSVAVELLALGSYGLKAELAPLLDKIALTIYKGIDLREDVVFSVALNQFEDASYLLSKAGYKNVMITVGQSGVEFAHLTPTDPVGLQRRVGYQDLSSDITLDAENVALPGLLQNKGKVALANLLPTALFSGGISSSVSQGFGDTYNLGDIVTLQGDYGLSQVARVAEFVRTQDSSGVKAYPTFETVS